MLVNSVIIQNQQMYLNKFAMNEMGRKNFNLAYGVDGRPLVLEIKVPSALIT